MKFSGHEIKVYKRIKLQRKKFSPQDSDAPRRVIWSTLTKLQTEKPVTNNDYEVIKMLEMKISR